MEEIWVATKSLIIYNRKILIIKRSKYAGGDENEWEFPGGGLKFGEDLLEGLAREIKEEVGLTVRTDKLLYAITRLVSPHRQIVGLTYLSYADTEKVTLSEEHIDFMWVTLSRFTSMLNKTMLNDIIVNGVLELLGAEVD